jgi:hypothetical protein
MRQRSTAWCLLAWHHEGVHLDMVRVVLADDSPPSVTQFAQGLAGHFMLLLQSVMDGKRRLRFLSLTRRRQQTSASQ